MSGTANDTMGTTNLSTAWAFFVAELRRGALAVVGGLGGVIALLLMPRLMPEAMRATGEDLRLAVALAGIVLVLPLLGLYLATSGWARERADGTLGWLYARPLSANAIFGLRVAAFAVTLAVFAALVLLATWTTPGEVFANPAISDFSGLYRYTPLLVPFLALSLFVSATAGRGRLAPTIAAAIGGLAGLALLPELPLPQWELLADPDAVFLRRGVLLYGVYPLALLAGAWVAVRTAVVDRRMRRRGVWAAAAIATAGALLSTALAAHQIWGDAWRPVAVRELPGGGEMTFSTGHGYDSWVLRLELAGADGTRVLPGVYLVPRLFASPRGGVAIFEGVRSSPRLRWIDGEDERAIEFGGAVQPIGWSPDGRYLALLGRGGETVGDLMLFDGETASLRPLSLRGRPEVGGVPRSGEWIDDRHLLLWAFGRAGWWAVAGLDGELVAEGQLAAEEKLQPSAELYGWPDLENGSLAVEPGPVPRRDGELLVWRWGVDERHQLVAVGSDGEFDVLAERSGVTPAFSLGVVGRTAVWIEDDRVLTLPAAAGGVLVSCAVPDGFVAGEFRGAVGRRAVWGPTRFSRGAFDRVFVCDLASGEGELVGDLGPWGSESAQVTNDGLLTPSGLRRLGG